MTFAVGIAVGVRVCTADRLAYCSVAVPDACALSVSGSNAEREREREGLGLADAVGVGVEGGEREVLGERNALRLRLPESQSVRVALAVRRHVGVRLSGARRLQVTVTNAVPVGPGSVCGAVWVTVGSAVGTRVRDALRSAVHVPVRDRVPVAANTADAVWDGVTASVPCAVIARDDVGEAECVLWSVAEALAAADGVRAEVAETEAVVSRVRVRAGDAVAVEAREPDELRLLVLLPVGSEVQVSDGGDGVQDCVAMCVAEALGGLGVQVQLAVGIGVAVRVAVGVWDHERV